MIKICSYQKDIAAAIGFSPGTISREIKRNGGTDNYSAENAHKQYRIRRKVSGGRKSFPIELYAFVKENLKKMSPDAIAGRLRLCNPNTTWHVSHQTIYNWVYSGWLGKGIVNFLLYGKKRYKKRGSKVNPANLAKKRIEDMPECARDRSRIGDWEGDTIIGAQQKGALITLVERKSRYILAKRLGNKSKDTFSKAMQWLFASVDNIFTILFDNGSEMANFETDEEMLGCQIYFAHPGRPYEKPVIENSNRLLRRFFPKKTNFLEVSDESVFQAVDALNHMPRKSLSYRTAQEVFFDLQPIAFDT
jgi:IS30 family transposase